MFGRDVTDLVVAPLSTTPRVRAHHVARARAEELDLMDAEKQFLRTPLRVPVGQLPIAARPLLGGAADSFDLTSACDGVPPDAALAALQDASRHLLLPVDVDRTLRELIEMNLDPPTIVERVRLVIEQRLTDR